jgi:hypothetical protein
VLVRRPLEFRSKVYYLATGHEETLFSALLAVSCLTHNSKRRKHMSRHQVALNWKKYQKLTMVILLIPLSRMFGEINFGWAPLNYIGYPSLP